MAAPVNSWEKFRLLLWKNWTLQWSSKWSLILEATLPLFFILILVLIRVNVSVRNIGEHNFKPIQIRNLDSTLDDWSSYSNFPRIIYYSPKNEIFENIVRDAAEILRLKGYKGFDNASALESALLVDKVLGGIQFDDSMFNITQYPEKFNFAIRQNATLANWSTKRLFQRPPLENHPTSSTSKTDDSWEYMGGLGYIRTGFASIQDAISMSYIKLRGKVRDLPRIVVQRFPDRPYVYDMNTTVLPFVASIIIILCFVYPASVLVKNITTEKEKQLKEIMKMMGLQNWLHWTAWFVRAFVSWFISLLIICVLLKLPLKDGVGIFNNTSWSLLLFFLSVYAAVSICYCFMFATFFNKSSIATAVNTFVWFVMYAPFIFFMIHQFELDGKWVCLLPNSALAIGLVIITQSEVVGNGLQWSNLFTPITIDDFSLGACMGVMLLSAIIFLMLCLYIEQVFPGEYGVPKKWYFLCSREYWYGEQYFGENSFNSAHNLSRLNTNDFEPEPLEKPAGLIIKNLSKKFSNKMAVRDLTINMYQDEITVLLGHNGAGKTTTISMLCGLFPPTSGTALVNGYDIRTNTERARSSMGICPQRNVLFDEMSVANHIEFFSRLKGVRGKAAIQAEIDEYLRILGLESKAKEKSKNLAGGMKRKLSMCCALCGDPKVVLCDEPSSGMDPASRRQLWDLLKKEKIRRTILLTTHFMDEADVLGDRIAIMCAGEVKCYGSTFFLKKKFGAGYKLICVKQENCNTSDVTAFLNEFIPDLRPASDVGTELIYLLPEYFVSGFKNMLAALENNSVKLNLSGIGIGISSMEEVFMRIGAEDFSSELKEEISNPTCDHKVESSKENNLFLEKSMLLNGLRLYLYQIMAMLLKKFLYTWRNKCTLALQLIVPIIIIVLAFRDLKMGIDNNFVKPFHLSLSNYPQGSVVLGSNFPSSSLGLNMSSNYKSVVLSFGENYILKSAGNRSLPTFLLKQKHITQSEINAKFIAGASFSDGNITAWMNVHAYQTVPISLNLVHNALARSLGPNTRITVTNAPLPPDKTLESGEMLGGLEIFMDIIVCFIMCFVTSFYVVFVIKERVSRTKLLQFVSGVGIWMYWLSQLLWDLVTFSIVSITIVITIGCFHVSGFSTFTELGKLFLLLMVFGLAALPFAYLSSYMAKQPATGFSRAFVLNLFCGLALFIGYKAFYGTFQSITYYRISRIFPHFSLAAGVEKLILAPKKSSRCSMSNRDKCQRYPPCCEDGFLYEGFEVELIYLLISGWVLFIIVILSEYEFFGVAKERIRSIFRKLPEHTPLCSPNLESEIKSERKEIGEMCKTDLSARKLVLDDVSKYYGKFLAVDRVSFSVKSFECFGLLGVNGAGKTTIFKMLTGDEVPTHGDIFVEGLNMDADMNKIYKKIGYCPQYDALLSELTGRETLRVFCLLRGVPLREINELIVNLAVNFGFLGHLDKQTAAYSGGSRRKLSTALAVLGNPTVIYLDEPTTGMDPASRRQLWSIICRIRDSGKSIVLTSHSMDECEALCTRLAIMVNGELKCIGSTQYLKNLYSKGLILKLKVKRVRDPLMMITIRESDFKHGDRLSMKVRRNNTVDMIKEFITLHFPNSELHEEFEDLLTFYIPFTNITWSQVFGVMEQNRRDLNIEDYSISQTTLEEIFLDFAKLQREDKRIQY